MGISTYRAQFDSPSAVMKAEQAARDLKNQMAGANPAQIIYFVDSGYDPQRMAAAMREAFPDTACVGCSTGHEIFNGKFAERAVVAMAFDADVFEFFDHAVISRLDADGKPNDPAKQVEEVFARFSAKLGRPMADLEHDKYVGIALADGRNYYIEPVLERAGDLTSVTFVGGAASDGGHFAFTPLLCDGGMHNDAVILVLAKPRGRFSLVKTEGLDLQEGIFTVTGADEEKRLVTHLDGRPAADVYREAIGIAGNDGIDLFGVLDQWPFGLMAGDMPFLRVVVEVLPDGALRFLNSVKEGMRFKIGRPTDIVDSTRASMEKVRAELGSISALLHFSCLSRLFVLRKQGRDVDFENLFTGYPSIGFFSHGEFFIAIANITSTMLVFA